MHLDGFKYWLAYTKGSKSYYRCSRSKSSKCPGKLIMEDSKVLTSTPHDHAKELKSNVVERFRRVLTKKAVEKPSKSLVDIYLEETLNYSEASILYPFSQAESTMRKARARVKEIQSKSEEKVEQKAANLSTAVEKEESEKEKPAENVIICFNDRIDENNCTTVTFETRLEENFTHTTEKDKNLTPATPQIPSSDSQDVTQAKAKARQFHKFFYHETHECFTLIVMNQVTLKTLGQIDELHVDGEVRIEQSHTLITVMALVGRKDCPLAFGLFPQNLTFANLTNFFQIFHAKIPLTPITVLTNVNELLQHTLKLVYPAATVKIMFFHYAQATLHALSGQARPTTDVFRRSSLKMMLAMPLVPTNYVVPGFEALRKWMSEKSVDMDAACAFIYDSWLSENAEKISIFNGLAHTVNHHMQMFTRDLREALRAGELADVNEIVERVARQASKSYVKFSRTNESEARKAQKLQKTVKLATKSWISSPFHLRRPIQFLQQVSHCIDDANIAFIAHFDGSEVKRAKNVQNLPPPLVFFGTEPPPLVMISNKK